MIPWWMVGGGYLAVLVVAGLVAGVLWARETDTELAPLYYFAVLLWPVSVVVLLFAGTPFLFTAFGRYVVRRAEAKRLAAAEEQERARYLAPVADSETYRKEKTG